MHKTHLLAALVLSTSLLAAAPTQANVDASTFGALDPRPIGPAVMGGRIAGLDAQRADDGILHVYVGAAGGGVWKSTDGAISFDPVFDDHVQSIGAVRIDPNDLETVWVGTGESWTRNSVSVGDGVYVSRDGGSTWNNVGLRDSERIARIQIDPKNSDRVWVCATGQLWSANEERGVFRTTDGGETWEPVLQIDEDTGCADLTIDPQNADVLYAGMWQFRRYPWSFTSGGPGSGLYRSLDGGDTWTELTQGLPEGEKGRIAVAVAPSRPNRVYATVEADQTALYRSDDLGNTWKETSTAMAVTVRPFYFSHMVVDPVDFDRVYKPGLFFAYSTDAGESFAVGGSMHSDLHAVWIDPANPAEILVGTDGGLYHSYDRGQTFRHAQALPISQYYEVGVDVKFPYNVYGGLQDNGSWMGPSRSSGGISGALWRNIGFGDGFHSYPDPNDADWIFVEYQGGQILRHQVSTGAIQQIKPYPADDEPDYRCSWNTAMHVGKASGRVYVGCQFLFQSQDGGLSWKRISDDLTTNDVEKQQQKSSGGLTVDNSTAENHTTIYSISESPTNPDVVWVGTDDGNVQVTRDGGTTWRNVRGNIRGVPAQTWVSFVEASHHDDATAFAAFDGHRLGDMQPYVFVTRDSGATWTALGVERNAAPVPGPPLGPAAGADDADSPDRANFDSLHPTLRGHVHVVRQDPVNPNLLFVGTELGLFVSLDGGAGWAPLGETFPQVGVRDLEIHPTQHDLVIGTHGRGIYILDDLTPLRALASEGGDALDSKLLPLPGRPVVQFISGQVQAFPGADEWVGQTLPETASIFYYQNRRHIFGDMYLDIFDANGEKVARFPAGKRKGINRVDWPMRLPPPELPPANALAQAMFGPRVPEGRYTYQLTKGKDVFEGSFELVADPRSPHSPEDRRVQQELANELYETLNTLTFTAESIVSLQEQAADRIDDAPRRKARELETFRDDLEDLRSRVVSTAEGGWLSGDEQIREQLGNLFGAVAGYDGRPTQSQIDRAGVLARQLEQRIAELDQLAGPDALATLNRGLETPIERLDRDAWQRERDSEDAPSGAAALIAHGLVGSLLH